MLVLVEDHGFSTPCHVWQGCVNSKGYGVRGRDGQRLLAHRIAYETAYGEIPAAHQIHHRCEQRRCLNPEHLQAITASEHNREHTGAPLAYRLYDVMMDGRVWSVSDLAVLLGVPRASVFGILRRAAQIGEVERTGRGQFRFIGEAMGRV